MNPTEFAASIDGGLAELRAYAEARMTSRCTIRRKTGTAPGPDGLSVAVWSTLYTDLPLRLAGESDAGQSRRVETAGVEFQIAMRTAHLPASTSNIRDGDLIEVTSGENSGAVLRVIESGWQDQATARRVPVAATTRPKEWS